MHDSYELESVVRTRRSRAWWVAALALSLAWVHHWPVGLLLTPLVVWRAVTPRAVRARLEASAAGLRIDRRLVPRRDIAMALLRHEGERTYVAIRGRTWVDVDVPNNIEADALVRGLALDAERSTVAFALTAPSSASVYLSMVAAALIVVAALLLAPSLTQYAFFGGVVLSAVWIWAVTRARLEVGADGVVVRQPLRAPRFLSHAVIDNVYAEQDALHLVVAGRDLALRLPGARSTGDPERRADEEQRADEMATVVRRIQQARRAFREHDADAETIAVTLRRGDRSTRQWLSELRRLGEGAASAFRTMGVARPQLLEVVESTSARARDRIAAAVALRGQLRDEERPRVRVAAERCVQPDLRARLLRIVELEDEAALVEALEASEREA